MKKPTRTPPVSISRHDGEPGQADADAQAGEM